MGKRAKTAKDFGVDQVTVVDFVMAGSSRAADLGGMSDDVSCVCCGARITNVFISNVGPLGGDCAATLTGDESTRAEIRAGVRAALSFMRAPRCARTVRFDGADVYCGTKFVQRFRTQLAAAAICEIANAKGVQ